MSANTHQSPISQDTQSWAEERLQLALAAGKMGIWELELKQSDRMTLSPELESIFEWEPGKFDGRLRTFLDRVHPADQQGVLRAIAKAIRHRTDPELEFRFRRQSRPEGWLLGRGRVYYNDQGAPTRLVGVGIDITAQKSAELEVLRLNAELEKRVADRTAQLQAANKELEAFCYSVSHDLRAPLRSIRGFSEVLLERYASKLDPRGQEFLRRSCESSHYMDELVDSLLKLSRVGRSDLSYRSVDLSQLASLIADELKASDPSRQVQFLITPDLRAYGDEHLIRLVLENLLRNAWKFTSKKPAARLELGRIDLPEKAFFVRDNGAGFDPAYGGRLFGVFQRLHSASEFPGVGVGLATVQRIINRHGGRVWADAAVDRGATFYFVLPENETQ
jgi:signal transduction histidine kinase